MSDRAEQYLARNKSAARGTDADVWAKFEQLYSKKLWHELGVEVRKFTNTLPFNVDLWQFYENFVSSFEHRLNPLVLSEIALPIADHVYRSDQEKAFEFLAKIERAVSKEKLAAIRIHVGQIKLRLEQKDKYDRCVDIARVRDMIEVTRKEVEDLVGVGPVHAPFYKVSSKYYQEIGDYASYYREALRYLGVEDVGSLTQEEKHVHAVLLGFAALLGEGIYNLGELLAHPILSSLNGSQESWIAELLFAFNSGDIKKLLELERYWGEWDDLKRRKEFLLSKIQLLALMEVSLQRATKNRELDMAEIAAACHVPVERVEHLVMRALSKKLIRGSIDQEKSKVMITWVQPRVLDTAQATGVVNRVVEWMADVKQMEALVATNAKEILTRA